MPTIIFAVFCIVYLGMILGGLPFLQLDRTGIALLGAIALIGIGAVSPDGGGQIDPSADADPVVLVHGGVGADAPGRLLRLGDAPARGAAAAAAAAAGGADPGRRGAFGGVQQRHRVPRRRAGADRRLPRTPPRPRALPARAGLRRQRRLGGDADRQPAEHAHRRDAEAVLQRLFRASAAAGAARPAGDLGSDCLADARPLEFARKR